MKQADLESKADRERIDAVATSTRAKIEQHEAVFGAKLMEIETQFDWLNDIVNMRDRNNFLLDSIVWEEVYKKPLPQPSLPNAGPGSASHPSRGVNGHSNGGQ
jgi:hypothetical protein